jgi:hypothetical protein
VVIKTEQHRLLQCTLEDPRRYNGRQIEQSAGDGRAWNLVMDRNVLGLERSGSSDHDAGTATNGSVPWHRYIYRP